ncbi:ABC transporter ATP-binding protein [bacterium]|nr:ABC transporter ATP-binding protein [bacterium]
MTPLVRFRSVTKSYVTGTTSTPVVQEISFDIEAGQSTAIVGPSGSGKSTILSLMVGLDSVDQGDIWIGDVNITQLSESKLARFRAKHVGVVFQSYRLIPSLTAVENVRLPLSIQGRGHDKARADSLLRELNLDHRLHHYPSQLSGGEQQRVAIARAIIHHPKLIMADEPTGNLDTKSGALVMALLKQYAATSTIVMVTHDPQLAASFDRQITVADGCVA